MQILVDFENGVPILIGTYWMQCIESFSVIWFVDIVANCGTKQNCKIAFDFKENIVVSWNFWLVYMNNIF